MGHQVGLECHDGGTVLGPHRDRKAMCGVTAETIRAQAADLADRMANATRVAFGSKDAVEAGKQLFDRIETL